MTPSTVLELAMKHCFPPVLWVKYPLLAGARSSFSDTEHWFCSGLQSEPLRASMHLSQEKGEHLFRIKSEPKLHSPVRSTARFFSWTWANHSSLSHKCSIILPWVMLSSSLLTLSQRSNNIPFILFYIIIQLIIFHFLRLQFGFRYQGFLFKHFFIKTDAHLFSALTPFSRVMFFNSLKHKVSIS